MKKVLFFLIFAVCLVISKTGQTQIPILYYDFENNASRTLFENVVELNVNSGSGALSKTGGFGSQLTIVGTSGAGILNGGMASGQSITTAEGGWFLSEVDPGPGAPHYYQFFVNTSGLSGISVSFDNQASETGPARVGILWSTNGVSFNTASTSPVLTGNTSFSSSGQFILPAGADNSTITIRVYAYSGNTDDRTGRSAFSESGTFSIDNLTVYASSLMTNAGAKTLVNESDFYSGITSGLTGDLIGRNNFTISNGASASLSSDVKINAGNTWRVTNGGTLTFGNNSLLESGAAAFTLDSGGTLAIGSPSGITSSGSSGNIQTTTRNFKTWTNYIYNGASAQAAGNALPDTVYNLTINNSNGVSLSSSTYSGGTLTLTSGSFQIGSNTLAITRAIQGTRANLSATTLSNLTVAGTGNGIVIPSSVTDLHNLTVTNFQSAGVLLEGSININNGTAHITGFVKLLFNNLTATGNSTISGNGLISLRGDLATQISGFTTNTFISTDGGIYSFVGLSAQTIPEGTYTNLQVSNSEGINLSGTVTVTGTITLNSTLNIGSATLDIRNPLLGTPTNLSSTSSSNLVISGNAANIYIPSSVSILNNLQIDNNQVVTADSSITISGILTLGASTGFFNMGANTLTIGTSTSNTGDIIRHGGSIRGIIKKWFTSGATSNTIFPFDNGFGAYSQAKITFNSLTTGGTLTAMFHNSGSGSLPDQGNGYYLPAPELHVNLINLAPQYWTITTGDGLAGANYNLEFTGDAIPNISNLNYITVIKRADSESPWTWNYLNHQTASGTNTNPVLYYNNGTSFSEFGVGGNAQNLLPVELLSFTSTININKVTLNWSTVSEENNSGFDVERKSAMTDWIKIGNVAGSGNSNTEKNYLFEDKNLQPEKYNYRLKQIDYNGNYKYYELSNEVIIGVPKKFALEQNYPNPFNPVTIIGYQLPVAGFVSLKLYDMTGKETASIVNGNQDAGFYSIKFDGSKLSSGIYFYTIKAGDFISTKKFVLVK